MNRQEFEESMLLLKKQVEMLIRELGMRAEFYEVKYAHDLPQGSKYGYHIRLEYNGYNTTDIFTDIMTFDVADINRMAVLLVSSFFRDYIQALSTKVNK
tara:strand:- start:148 stop:444 length:297 start_codon:yes stop_codon:yes gene_type:complete